MTEQKQTLEQVRSFLCNTNWDFTEILTDKKFTCSFRCNKNGNTFKLNNSIDFKYEILRRNDDSFYILLVDYGFLGFIIDKITEKELVIVDCNANLFPFNLTSSID